MSIKPINIGSAPNDGTGQDLRSGGAVINANFQELDQRVDGKQDGSPHLSALAGAGDVGEQSLPVYANNSAAYMAPVTNAGLTLVRQPGAAGMQAQLGLVPVAHPNDITPGRLVTPRWMGLGTTSSNRLPDDNAQVAVPAGEYYTTSSWAGAPYPSPDPRNQGFLSVRAWENSGFMAQEWRPLQRSSSPNMHRFAFSGQWQPWQVICSGVTTQDSQFMNQKLEMRNVLGVGVPHTYCVSLDAKNADEGIIYGYSYVTNTTVGTKPGGYVYGVVNTVVNSNDHLQQNFVGLNGVGGVTQREYRRTGYGPSAGAWGPWQMVIDSVSATYDVETTGGVVSRTIISGCVVNKFASGLIVINGNFGTTPSIAANAQAVVNLTVPANTGPDVSYATACCVASPFVSNDWYGITNAYMSTATNLQIVIRNGAASAQQFGVRGIIIGHWK